MKVAEEVKTKVAEAVKTISVVGLMTILLTIVIWFAAKKLLPPSFDAKERALLFFVCYVICYFGVRIVRRIWGKKSKASGAP